MYERVGMEGLGGQRNIRSSHDKSSCQSKPAPMNKKDFSVNTAERDRCVYRWSGEGLYPHAAYTNT